MGDKKNEPKNKETLKSKPSKKAPLEALQSEAPARPNSRSIMSAPEKKKSFLVPALFTAVAISVVLNIVFIIVVLSNAETISVLRSQVKDYKEDIINLKNQINSLDK